MRKKAYDAVRFLAVKNFLKFCDTLVWDNTPPESLEKKTDRCFYFNLLQGMVRHHRLLENEISKRVKLKFEKLEKVVKGILIIGAYQIIFMDKIPTRASIYETVELAPPFGVSHRKSLINGVLRNLRRDLNQKNHFHDYSLALRTSHPDWMVTRWNQFYSPKEVQEICEANNQFDGVTIKVYSSCSPEQLICGLHEEGIIARQHDILPGALIIEESIGLFKTQAFKSGKFYVQDASSQIFLEIISPLFRGKILDLCAAPGGKSIGILEHSSELDLVVNDISFKRMGQLRENFKRLNLPNPQITITDGSEITFKQVFDTILLDVSCSATGTIKKNPDLKHVNSVEKLLNKIKLQRKLLNSVAQCIRPGGYLIYSTCSIEREENADQIENFLKQHSDFNLVNCLQLVNKESFRKFCVSKGYFQSLPSCNMMGLFGAILRYNP